MVYYKIYRTDIGKPLYIRARHVQVINGAAIFHRDDMSSPVFAIGASWWQSFAEVDEDLKPTCVKTHKEVEAKHPERDYPSEDEPSPGDDKHVLKTFDMAPPKKGKRGFAGGV